MDLQGLPFGGAEPHPRQGRECEHRCALCPTISYGKLAAWDGCGRPVDAKRLAFLQGQLALTRFPQCPHRIRSRHSLHVPAASTPKLLLNVEMDDYGIVEHGRTGARSKLWVHKHLREIRASGS